MQTNAALLAPPVIIQSGLLNGSGLVTTTHRTQKGAYKLSSEVGDADTPSGGVCDMAFRSDSSRSDAADECMSDADRFTGSAWSGRETALE